MTRRKAFKRPDGRLDQGDVLSNVPFVRWKDGRAEEGAPTRGLVTSNGCACEDYERALAPPGRSSAAARIMIQVAPLRPASQFSERQIDEIRQGKQLDYFFVHGEGTFLADQVADLTFEQPIPASILAACTKSTRLADWQWQRLLIHHTVSRFHQQPETLFLERVLVQAIRET